MALIKKYMQSGGALTDADALKARSRSGWTSINRWRS